MLFEILWCHGYVRLNKYKDALQGQPAATWPPDKDWRDMLPKELHVFAGNFLGPSSRDKTPFQFQAAFPPKVSLAPPPSGITVRYICTNEVIPACVSLAVLQLTHYNWKEYSMRLIGNAFSVPAVEQVLFRLKELFGPSEEQRCKELYSKWQYPYKWETPESNATIHEETIPIEEEQQEAIHGEAAHVNEEDFMV